MSQLAVANINLYDDDSSMNDDSTIDTSHAHIKNRAYEDTVVDPDCRTYSKTINRKRRIITYYVTNTYSGKTIRDAITGMHYKHYMVGTSSENIFFKVSFCQGNTSTKTENSQNGETLFYMSPLDYEKHMRVTLPTYIKDAWRVKSDKFSRILTLSSSHKNM